MARHHIVGCIAFLMIFLSSNPVLAQNGETFRVSSYVPERFEDLKFSVSGGASLFGDSRKNSYQHGDGSYRSDVFQFLLDPAASAAYRQFSRETDVTLATYVSMDYVRRTEERADTNFGRYPAFTERLIDSRSSRYSIDVSQSVDHLSYYSGDLFAAISGQFTGWFTQTLDDDADQTFNTTEWQYYDSSVIESTTQLELSNYSRSRVLRGSLAFSLGLGRLYEGRYAAIALALVSELGSAGLLKREPSFDEMTHLSDLVYRYYSEHAIDSRLFRIEKLSAILAYLQGTGIVSDPGAAGPFLIEDIVLYYPRYQRAFGGRVRFGVGSDWQFSKLYDVSHTLSSTRSIHFDAENPEIRDTTFTTGRSRSIYQSRATSEMPFTFIQGEYAAPFSMRWQVNALASARAYFAARTESFYYTSTYSDKYGALLQTGLTYILDTRTSANLTVESSYNSFREHRNPPKLIEDDYYGPSIRLLAKRQYSFDYDVTAQLTYRVSLPTTLSFSVTYSGEDVRISSEYGGEYDRHGYRVAARVLHWIF